MSNWELLGIEPTTDTLKIKEAYMEKLSDFHPEEDPEGFKKLRATYEELLEIAAKGIEEKDIDNGPLGTWINKINEIYNNFEDRLNIELWKDILNEDVCFSLETKEEACMKLLEFLYDNFYLPHNIWLLIEEVFSIKDRYKEFYEYFAPQFIDYIVNEIEYGDSLNYELFEIEDGKDYEHFIKLYFDIRGSLNRRELDNLENKISEMKELYIYHPYSIVLEARYNLIQKNIEIAKYLCDEIIEEYDEDLQVLSLAAEIEWEQGSYNEAKVLYEKILSLYPNNYSAKVGYADCCLELEDPLKAHGIYIEILGIDPYNNYVRENLFKSNEKIIEKYYEELKTNKDDKKLLTNLCWCLFENYRYDEALEVGNSFKPDEPSLCEYYDLLGRIYSGKGDHEKAYSCFSAWVNKIEKDMENSCLDEESTRPAHAYFQKARQLEFLNHYSESLECYNKALDLDSEETLYLNYKSQVLYKMGRYEESINIIEKSIDLDNSQAGAYISRAKSYYKLYYYREAMDDCNTAIDIYPFFTEPYLLKIQIYDLYDRYEDMLEVIKDAERFEVVSDDILALKVRALSHMDKIKEAEELGLNLIEKVNNKEINDCLLASDIYYEMSMVAFDLKDNLRAIRYINSAIAANPEDNRNLGFKGYIYKEIKNYNEALKIYMDFIEMEKDNSYGYMQVASIYDEMKKYDIAIEWYQKAIEIYPEVKNANYYISKIYEMKNDMENALKFLGREIEIEASEYLLIHRGILYADMNKFEEALNDYNEALKLEPNSKYAYNNIGCLYKDREDYKTAINYFKKAIELDTDNNFVNCYNNAYNCYINTKDYVNALNICNEGIEALPNQDSLYLNKGKVLIKIGEFKEALIALLKANEIEENNIDNLETLGECYIFLGNYDEAINVFLKIMKLDSKHESAYCSIAEIYIAKKEYKKALMYMKKQVELSPANLENSIKLGFNFKLCGKKLSANSTFKKVLKKYFAEKNLSACDYCYIGKCYVGMNDSSEANRYLKLAIESCQNSNVCEHEECFEAFINLALLCEQENKIEDAIMLYKRALNIKGESDKDCAYAFRRLKGGA